MTGTPIVMSMDELPAIMRGIEQHIRSEYGDATFSIKEAVEEVYWGIVGIGNEPRPVASGEVNAKLGEKLESEYKGFNFREFLVKFLEELRSNS